MAENMATIERPVQSASREEENALVPCVRESKADKTSPVREKRGSRKRKADSASEENTRAHNIELGRRGEDAAARFLDRRGYEIVARNWMCLAGEADIIARDGETLVFVEVKTRSSCQKGMPSEAVTTDKRKRYENIAMLFLQDYDAVDVPVRFDIIAIVVMEPDRAFIRHHINAFSAG